MSTKRIFQPLFKLPVLIILTVGLATFCVTSVGYRSKAITQSRLTSLINTVLAFDTLGNNNYSSLKKENENN